MGDEIQVRPLASARQPCHVTRRLGGRRGTQWGGRAVNDSLGGWGGVLVANGAAHLFKGR